MWTRGLRLREMNFCPELLFEAMAFLLGSGSLPRAYVNCVEAQYLLATEDEYSHVSS